MLKLKLNALLLILFLSGSETNRFIHDQTIFHYGPGINGTLSEKLDFWIEFAMKNMTVPGAFAGILENGNLLHARGYGFSNVEHRVPVKLETIFQSGSVGKQFTAMAILILVEREQLKLDDPIRIFFTDSPSSWQNITVRHLLTHTSGMGNYPENFNFRNDYTEEEIYELIKTIPLLFLPGNSWRYSNLGYVMLGVLIQRVTGQFYGDFLKENVFQPLNMTTARVINELDIIPNRASGYMNVDGEIKNQIWVSPTLNSLADGALYLSFDDMVKWDAALRNRLILKSSKTYEDMWSPVRLNNGSTYDYGFGWSLETGRNGMKIVEHGGSWQGFQAMFIRVLDINVTVIFFANLNHGEVYTIGYLMLQIFNPELLPDLNNS